MRSPFTSLAVMCALISCVTSMQAECDRNPAQDAGERMGRAFVKMARALGEAFVRAKDCEVNCNASDPAHSSNSICAAEHEIEAALDDVESASESGCLKEGASYEATSSYHMFRVLQDGLSLPEAVGRWNVLERIYWLCETKTLLADAADSACRGEVEKGCLRLLSTDDDPTNRLRALEILSGGYATVNSLAPLENLVRTTLDERQRKLAEQVLSRLRSGEE